MSAKNWKIASIVLAVVMAAAWLVSFGIGGCDKLIECESGSFPMRCHWAFIACGYLCFCGVVTAVYGISCKTKEARCALMTVCGVETLAAAVIVSPLGIGLCGTVGMHCWQTAYITWALNAVAFIITIVMYTKADPAKGELPKMEL